MKFKFIFKIFLLLFFELKLRVAFSIKEHLNNTYNYRNELCSYNGIPTYNHKTNEVTCECKEKYTNEPKEEKRKYINGHLVQCSYEKKSRLTVLFYALCIPFGTEFLYLQRYKVFAIVFCLSIGFISLNSYVFFLNYKINMRSKETKIQNKINNLYHKEENQNLNKNNKCIKILNIIAKITAYTHILYMFFDILAHGLGYITDVNHVETENDLGYLFNFAD